MKKFKFTFLMLVGSVLLTSAQDIVSDGLKYVVVDDNKLEVVGFATDNNSSSVIIPPIVADNGIDYSVSGIGKDAFSGNLQITNIDLPSGLKYISEGAFRNCSNVTALFNHSNVVEYVGDEAFMNTSFPEFSNLAYTKNIGNRAFYNSGLLVFSCIGTVGDEAFANSALQMLYIFPNSTMGKGCFKNCINLKEVLMDDKNLDITTPDYSYNLPEEAFAGCTSFVNLILPTNIGTMYGNSLSESLRALQIQDNLPNIIFVEGDDILWNKIAVAIPDNLVDEAKQKLAPLFADKYTVKVYEDDKETSFYYTLNDGKAFGMDPNLMPKADTSCTLYSPKDTLLSIGLSYSMDTSSENSNWGVGSVTLNDVDITEDCSFPYIFAKITQDSVIKVITNSGVDAIIDSLDNEVISIHDLSGNCYSDLNGLYKGIYIIKTSSSTKKVIVK